VHSVSQFDWRLLGQPHVAAYYGNCPILCWPPRDSLKLWVVRWRSARVELCLSEPGRIAMFHNSRLRFTVRPNPGMDVEGGIAGLPDDRSFIKKPRAFETLAVVRLDSLRRRC